jgi:hypothetical protein
VDKLIEWTLAGIVGGIIALILGTFFQKPLDHLHDELYLWAFAEPIIFESTKVSGCSGGNLGSLVSGAQKKGLQVDSQVSDSLLCASWRIRLIHGESLKISPPALTNVSRLIAHKQHQL